VPFKIQYNEELGLFTLFGTGELKLPDFARARDRMVRHRAYEPSTDSIWELDKASLQQTGSGVAQIVSLISARCADDGSGRVSIVLPKDLEPEFVKTMRVMAADAPTRFFVARSNIDAGGWLQYQEDLDMDNHSPSSGLS